MVLLRHGTANRRGSTAAAAMNVRYSGGAVKNEATPRAGDRGAVGDGHGKTGEGGGVAPQRL